MMKDPIDARRLYENHRLGPRPQGLSNGGQERHRIRHMFDRVSGHDDIGSISEALDGIDIEIGLVDAAAAKAVAFGAAPGWIEPLRRP